MKMGAAFVKLAKFPKTEGILGPGGVIMLLNKLPPGPHTFLTDPRKL